MDSDDDLQLPPPKPTIQLDDSDDDLPPPAALAAKKPPIFKKTNPAASPTSPSPNNNNNNNNNNTNVKIIGSPNANNPPKVLTNTSNQNIALQKGKNQVGSQVQIQSPTDSKVKAQPIKVYKEGFLFKQQPSWPYSNQKRYCVLKNCRLYYFDSQENMKEGRPQGVIDLTNAKLVDPGNEAKLPSNFGIHVQSDKQTEGGNNNNKKERTFIFAVTHAHELGEWKSAIQAIVGDTIDDEEQKHWFEKMVQGVY